MIQSQAAWFWNTHSNHDATRISTPTARPSLPGLLPILQTWQARSHPRGLRTCSLVYLSGILSFAGSLLISFKSFYFFFFPFFPLRLDLNIPFFSTLFSNIFPGLLPFSILTPCFNLLIRTYHFLTYCILCISLAYRLSVLLECKLPEGRDFFLSTAVLPAPKTVPGKY